MPVTYLMASSPAASVQNCCASRMAWRCSFCILACFASSSSTLFRILFLVSCSLQTWFLRTSTLLLLSVRLSLSALLRAFSCCDSSCLALSAAMASCSLRLSCSRADLVSASSTPRSEISTRTSCSCASMRLLGSSICISSGFCVWMVLSCDSRLIFCKPIFLSWLTSWRFSLPSSPRRRLTASRSAWKAFTLALLSSTKSSIIAMWLARFFMRRGRIVWMPAPMKTSEPPLL
mmetsp:Transcript_21896/g.60781  ORF Transcript_21896/g.60781 Transcript_21896/m.60781 type:complete len:233 (+) Transcript_21896:1021-1719(+)